MIQQLLVKEPISNADEQIALPVCFPELDEVRHLADQLHRAGQEYEGQYKGWPVVYHPADSEPPTESWSVPFAASFQLGIWPVWSIHIDWEDGDDQPPNVWTWDKNLVSEAST